VVTANQVDIGGQARQGKAKGKGVKDFAKQMVWTIAP
jgi:hypothetical protein